MVKVHSICHSHFRTAGSQVARRAAGGAARILDEQQVLNAAHNESQLKSAQRHLQRAGSSCANERVWPSGRRTAHEDIEANKIIATLIEVSDANFKTGMRESDAAQCTTAWFG